MSIYEIYQIIVENPGRLGFVIALVFIVFKLVKINPFNIQNPISMIGQKIGQSITKDLSDQMKEMNKKIDDNNEAMKTQLEGVEKKVDKIDYQFHEHNAVEARTRILRFGDEVSHGKNHSRDHFQQVLLDITNYNQYCVDHKNFKNDMTKITAERIKEDYMIKDRDNSFLV